MPAIDLNADLGEGCPFDAALIERISSANVGCGAHAGDADTIRATLQLARDRAVVVGAHPGYPDREHFGRRSLPLTAQEVRRLVESQVADLRSLAAPLGVAVCYLKPHGALYNQAQSEPEIAEGVLAAAAALGLPLLALPTSLVARRAAAYGVPIVREGFADRRYRPDGLLAPRSEPGAILIDPAEIRAQLDRLLAQGHQTICLHGDHAHSVDLADLVREHLAARGVAIRPFLDRSGS
ncbi:MAG: UPF0271 protein rni3 [Isosphaeraceae bacterium]|jgi:UPF0271 protein|nr:MAG: UPF0271 protein rni3 [Isosphaeraceae bacterium]